jgi:hypothetical protein
LELRAIDYFPPNYEDGFQKLLKARDVGRTISKG